MYQPRLVATGTSGVTHLQIILVHPGGGSAVGPLLYRQVSFGQAQFCTIIVNPIKPVNDRGRLVRIRQ